MSDSSANRRQSTLKYNGRLLEFSLTVLRLEASLPASLRTVLQSSELAPDVGWSFEGSERFLRYFESLLLQTEGPCVALYPRDSDGATAITETMHELRGKKSGQAEPVGRCIGIDLKDGTQLILTAIPPEAGGDMETFESVLLGFHISHKSCQRLSSALEHSMLPLVLDIDETLVVAHTLSGLSKRLTDARRRRSQLKRAYAQAESPAQQEELLSRLRAVETEEKSLSDDHELLEEFMDSDCATIDGNLHEARLELVDEWTHRPVIRKMDKCFILTRINPDDPQTSMIIRLRPGWEELRGAILGQDNPASKQAQDVQLRFDVYVCTTAHRPYALEVWRLLDPSNSIIPRHSLPHRMANVDQSVPGTIKRLATVFSLGSTEAEDSSPFPTAVIADDRTDVWSKGSQGQIIKVEPYAPYRRAAELAHEVYHLKHHPSMIPWLGLIPLKDRIVAIRKHFYYNLNLVLRQSWKKRRHVPEKRRLVWPRIKTPAELLSLNLREPPRPPRDGEEVESGKPDIVIDIPSWDSTAKPGEQEPNPVEGLSALSSPVTWPGRPSQEHNTEGPAWAARLLDKPRGAQGMVLEHSPVSSGHMDEDRGDDEAGPASLGDVEMGAQEEFHNTQNGAEVQRPKQRERNRNRKRRRERERERSQSQQPQHAGQDRSNSRGRDQNSHHAERQQNGPFWENQQSGRNKRGGGNNGRGRIRPNKRGRGRNGNAGRGGYDGGGRQGRGGHGNRGRHNAWVPGGYGNYGGRSGRGDPRGNNNEQGPWREDDEPNQYAAVAEENNRPPWHEQSPGRGRLDHGYGPGPFAGAFAGGPVDGFGSPQGGGRFGNNQAGGYY